MADRRRRTRGEQEEDGLVKALRFGVIPLVVIVLIVVIIQMDKRGGSEGDDTYLQVEYAQKGKLETTAAPEERDGEEGEDNENGVSGSGETQDTAPEDSVLEDRENGGEGQPEGDQIPTADPSQYPLQQDAILELTGLVQSYCQAKEECDPELLAWVFGIDSWTEEEKSQEKARMELVKASVKKYENVSCYSIQGPEPDSYVIFPYYEIRYRETDTLMPAFSWGYAKKDDSGRYYMVQNVDSGVNDYIRKVGQKPEVRAVMAQIQGRQQQAIAADEVLEKIYGTTGASEVIIGGVGG